MFLRFNNNLKGNIKDFDTLKIVSESIKENNNPHRLKIQIRRLITPEKIKRARFWSEPDTPIYDSLEFRKLFPLDEYHNEHEVSGWPVGSVVFDTSFVCGHFGPFSVSGRKWNFPGRYRATITLSEDEHISVRYIANLEIAGADSSRSLNQALNITECKTNLAPSTNSELVIGSGFDSCNALVIFYSEGREIQGSRLIIAGKKDTVTTEFSDQEQKPIVAGVATYKDNRLYTSQLKICDSSVLPKIIVKPSVISGNSNRIAVKVKYKQNSPSHFEIFTVSGSLDSSGQPVSESVNLILREKSNGDINFVARQPESVFYDRSISDIYMSEPNQPEPDLTVVSNSGLNLHTSGNEKFAGLHIQNDSVNSTKSAKHKHKRTGGRQHKPATINNSGSHETLNSPMSATITNSRWAIDRQKPALTETHQPGDILPQPKAMGQAISGVLWSVPVTADSLGVANLDFRVSNVVPSRRSYLLAHDDRMNVTPELKKIEIQAPFVSQMMAPTSVYAGDTFFAGIAIKNLTDSELCGNVSLVVTDSAGIVADSLYYSVAESPRYFSAEKHKETQMYFKLFLSDKSSGKIHLRFCIYTGKDSVFEEEIRTLSSRSGNDDNVTPFVLSASGREPEFNKKNSAAISVDTTDTTCSSVVYATNPFQLFYLGLPAVAVPRTSEPIAIAEAIAATVLGNYFADSFYDFTTVAQVARMAGTGTEKHVESEIGATIGFEISEALKQHGAALLPFSDSDAVKKRIDNYFRLLVELQKPSGAFPWVAGMQGNNTSTLQVLLTLGLLKNSYQYFPPTAFYVTNKACEYLDHQFIHQFDLWYAGKIIGSKETVDKADLLYIYLRNLFQPSKTPRNIASALSAVKSEGLSQIKYLPEVSVALVGLICLQENDDSGLELAKRRLNELLLSEEKVVAPGIAAQPMHAWQLALVAKFCLAAKIETKLADKVRRQLFTTAINQYQPSEGGIAAIAECLNISGAEAMNMGRVVPGNGRHSDPVWPEICVKGRPALQYFIKDTSGVASRDLNDNSEQGDRSAENWGLYFGKQSTSDSLVDNKGISVVKQLSLLRNDRRSSGPQSEDSSGTKNLKVGEKVLVKLTVSVPADEEHVRITDLLPECFQSRNVFQGERRSNGFNYYTTMTDNKVCYYIEKLREGTYNFEYIVYTSEPGKFEEGSTQISVDDRLISIKRNSGKSICVVPAGEN